MKTKISTAEKKQLLQRFFELKTYLAHDYTFYMGKPLNYYDYDKLKKEINNLEKLYNEM
jgi:hypothetical protein